jgi:assimilatory nitrate reductase catalytic subunit
VNHAQCLFIAGSNTAFAHPILFRRIEDAKKANPALKVIVADPRRTDTAGMADLHLPIQPGTDVMLFTACCTSCCGRAGWTPTSSRPTPVGFDALKATVRDCTPVCAWPQTCGIAKDDLLTAARWFAGMQHPSPAAAHPHLEPVLPGPEPVQQRHGQERALINLHLATGQIGKPGAGPFSLTGQPNAMGGREVGGMANLLSAHRDLANPAHRAEVAALWGVPSVPEKPGKTAVEMFQAAADGEIKALWIACTNPAQSMPDQATVRRALQRAEFVVVQEAFATAATCDLCRPAAARHHLGRKRGHRHQQRTPHQPRARRRPPGPGSTDAPATTGDCGGFAGWSGLLAPGRPGLSMGPGGPQPVAVPLRQPRIHLERTPRSTRGRDLDITGLSYAMLDAAPSNGRPEAAANCA